MVVCSVGARPCFFVGFVRKDGIIFIELSLVVSQLYLSAVQLGRGL